MKTFQYSHTACHLKAYQTIFFVLEIIVSSTVEGIISENQSNPFVLIVACKYHPAH